MGHKETWEKRARMNPVGHPRFPNLPLQVCSCPRAPVLSSLFIFDFCNVYATCMFFHLQQQVFSRIFRKKFQVKRQSRNIIATNPAISPKVASLAYPFLWLSGIISSLTTKSIAPAAKASPQGRIG